MNRHMLNITLVLITSCLMSTLSAKPQYGPVIKNYGPIYEVSNKDVPLPKDFKYKVVFDVYETATQMDMHSRRLESVARFINMHALEGVPIENMQIAVVFHGKAAKDILTDEMYQKKHELDNPNRELIETLAASGVELFVCGQTAKFHKYQREDILPEIKVALSAMTQLVIYQSKGYALLP